MAAPDDVIRVLLVDDQQLFREGLRTLLGLHEDLRVVGEARDGLEAETLTERLRPHVVLMDLRMPRRDGVAATRRLAGRWPAMPILVLTTFDDDELVFQAIEAGAAGYLLKDVGSEALAEAIRATHRGESPLQPSVARKVLRRVRASAAAAPAELPPLSANDAAVGLTAREDEILRLIGTGASNREIAERLYLTEGTVKNYVSAILAKTGFRDRTQAALYAARRRLVP